MQESKGTESTESKERFTCIGRRYASNKTADVPWF